MEQRDERTEHVLRQKNDPHVCRPQRKDTGNTENRDRQHPLHRSFAAIGHDADNQKLLLPRKPHREIPARPAWRQVARLFLHRLHFVQLQRNGGRTGRNHDIQPPRRYTLQVPVERREIGPAHDDGQYSVLSNILLEHRTRQDDIHDPLL